MNTIKQYSDMIEFLLETANLLSKERQRRINKGENINIFSLWNDFSGLTEPIHSRILHFFLSSNPMHGQGNRFLNIFLKHIGIQSHKDEEWVSTVEIGRVDVMLKRFHPHGLVIIENKSNGAEDQPNQLYRYWYKNIHHCNDDCTRAYYELHPEYKIVYLVPNKEKKINDDSLTRPIDYPEYLPDTIPIKPIVFSFQEEISSWLEDCIDSLPEENIPLKNLLLQYEQYCKNL
ncbi:MAG: PD-(D/E)XK nuclease family protein [Bacteroidales bacterium]|nr:PD-(D/E)XK nuclease family protein [Bacteroidales bacterium]